MHVLLLEPNYYTQYPPLGLLKISAYHKKLGDTVQYLHGVSKLRHLHTYPEKIYVTSLFTWAWQPVEEAIRFARLYFPSSEILLGGVYASLMPGHAATLGADRVVPGVWNELEDLLPDYSIVPKWSQEQKASIMFTHRGCIRKCSFCAVPALEGKPRQVRKTWEVKPLIAEGHNKVIFWDNNILGVSHWPDVIKEVKKLGLKVDFNQGLDARLITEEVAEAFRGLHMPVIRIAYDFPGMGKHVKAAIDNLERVGFSKRRVVSYVLFNFTDNPEQLYERVENLISWGATAYPMRYQPLDTLKKDDYVGEKWTQDQLKMVAQARRVIGIGGAFPPYEGLVKKFQNSKTFEDAFSLWSHNKTTAEMSPSFGNVKKTFHFLDKEIRNVGHNQSSRSNKVLATLIAPNASALGGHYVLLVSTSGAVKRTSLLNIYQNVSSQNELPLLKGDQVQNVIPSNGQELLALVTASGRVAVFDFNKIASQNLDRPFSKRLKVRQDDTIIASLAGKYKDTVVIVTNLGYAWTARLSALNVKTSQVVGFSPFVNGKQSDTGHIVGGVILSGNSAKIRLTSNRRHRRTISIDLDNIPTEEDAVRQLWALNDSEQVKSVCSLSSAVSNDTSYQESLFDMGQDHQWTTHSEPHWTIH